MQAWRLTLVGRLLDRELALMSLQRIAMLAVASKVKTQPSERGGVGNLITDGELQLVLLPWACT